MNTAIESAGEPCKTSTSTALTSEYRISPSLSAFSAKPQFSKTSLTEKIYSTEMKFSAQNLDSQEKSKNAQNSLLKIRELIQEQKAKLASKNVAPKKVDFQKLISLLNTKKNSNGQGKLEEPNSGKSLAFSATKLFSSSSKVLQPSLIGNAKFCSNLQNIMNQRKAVINQTSQLSSSNLARISNSNKQTSECSEGQLSPAQKGKDQLNLSQLQILLNQSTCSLKKQASVSKQTTQLLGKRKRKTERELKILRNELKKNLMWTRDSIKIMRAKYEKDFEMSEQQIYKWWWDQTRKRSKKTTAKDQDSDQENLAPEPTKEDCLVSFQDEFGGYSSRLRINQKEKVEELDVDLNLCELLGIDVEGIALKLALEDEENSDMGPTSPVSEHNRNLDDNEARLQLLMDFSPKAVNI